MRLSPPSPSRKSEKFIKAHVNAVSVCEELFYAQGSSLKVALELDGSAKEYSVIFMSEYGVGSISSVPTVFAACAANLLLNSITTDFGIRRLR